MRQLICSVPLVVLLGCAGTVEVEGLLANLDDVPGNDVQTAAVEVPVPPSHCR